MASTKRTRNGSSKRLKTIIWKDLQSLREWKDGQANCSISGDDCFSSLFDDKYMLCNETLEDLEDVWARPPQPKRPNKAQTKRSWSQTASSHSKLPEDENNHWSTPIKGKRAKKTQSRQTASRCTLPGTHDPGSPVAQSSVPPNSPTDLSPAGQSTPNPYITFLIQSWEAGSPLLVTRPVTSAAHTTFGHDASSPVLQPMHEASSPVLQSMHGSSDPVLQSVYDGRSPVFQSMHEASMQSIHEASSPVLQSMYGSGSSAVQQSLEDESPGDMALVRPDDVLIFPDGSQESFPSEPPTAQCAEEEPAQCVPEAEDEAMERSQSSQEGEESLFGEGGFVSLQQLPQETDCQLDHVVPCFELELEE